MKQKKEQKKKIKKLYISFLESLYIYIFIKPHINIYSLYI